MSGLWCLALWVDLGLSLINTAPLMLLLSYDLASGLIF